jgi:hypothetical protein
VIVYFQRPMAKKVKSNGTLHALFALPSQKSIPAPQEASVELKAVRLDAVPRNPLGFQLPDTL